jgi:cobaltochelatase CobN
MAISPSTAPLRETGGIDALIHLGTHGTTEWLPGKAVALSAACWPRLVTQGLPVVYPLCGRRSRRGGAGQATALGGDARPSAAAAGGDRGPPATTALLRDLVEEFSAGAGARPAPGRHRRRAKSARGRRQSGLAESCGVDAGPCRWTRP